jgi:dynactin 1
MATSQKALAQAAQLAADASAARKRDCDAVFDRIDARSATYLCQRIESLLPSGVVSAELAAVKGEIDLSMVADKAAVSLSTLQQVFEKGIEKGLSGVSEFNVLEEGTNLILSDGSAQQISIATMIHQAEFASLAIGVASDALRFMAAGQWPDLMSEDLSTDMGSVVVHSISQLDLSLSEQLRLLKQEGALSPLRSSLSELNQSAQNTKLALFSISDQLGKPVIPSEWNPPALLALKSLSLGRFDCLGATAVLASAICPFEKDENEPPAPTLANLAAVLEKAKLSCSNVSDVCKKFSGLGLNNLETIESLNELASKYQTSSRAFFDCVKVTFTQQSISSDDVVRCASLLEEVVTLVRQLSALLRKADLGEHDSSNFHELSPEYGDSWGGVARVVAQVRAVDGDPEDVNYLMRARAIEQQLTNAVQNGPKLEKANARIASLEKVRVYVLFCIPTKHYLYSHSCYLSLSPESRIAIQRNCHAKLAHFRIGKPHYKIITQSNVSGQRYQDTRITFCRYP